MKLQIPIALTILTAVLLSGCGGQIGSASGAPSAQTPAPTATAATAAEEALSLNGSVAALPVMIALTEGFSQKTGGAADAVASGKEAAMTAVTSGEANFAVYDGTADEAPDGTAAKVIAYQAVAVVINTSAGVRDLKPSELSAIFSGQSTDWSDFGGKGPITLIVPEKSNAFRIFFEENFGLRESGNGIAKSLIPDSAAVSDDPLEDTKATEGAVCICSADKVLGTGEAIRIGGIELNRSTLEDGTYPACRSVVFLQRDTLTAGEQAFCDYLSSADARTRIQDAGFLPKDANP
ncbi:substrate-binding domain-containing protein [Papillibacter cinnamivorans]|uniref:PBP superfamily domain-containing protein n=1 Tax=Papillibacter cinnamivorans DSM 12816 TaxID=1122930 RepID=A0A1W1YNR3_9FIRM|nr:substrate-binding domain-containing protein [Papillibacter cinnamivorans]SMC37807.1 PBP superfamily domain-containing protein [Papillibacter cinnamivorans DSM 12816]